MSLFAMKKKKGYPGARQWRLQHFQRSLRREMEQVTAGRSLVKEMREEMTCPICLEYFKDPVILDCGHNFCQDCLTQCWDKTDRDPSCPQCREIFQPESFRANRQLANLVELVKKLQVGKGAKGKWGECEKHQEPLKLFCDHDQVPICVVCDRSIAHRMHSVLPMEEAFLEYKKVIQAQLQFLERERKDLKEEKTMKDQISQRFLALLVSEKQETKSAFQQTQNYLGQLMHLRLSKLEEMEKEMEKTDEKNHTRFSEEISDLNNLITELEGKFKEPETVFVQNPKTILSRYEKKPERQLVELPLILVQNLRIYSEQIPGLQKALKECEESLDKMLEEALTKVNVTLASETAHPILIVSEDRKSMRYGNATQNLPISAERFDTLQCVLGCEKFTSGRHWWEVEVGISQAVWGVGVAKESVMRKGNITLKPEEGFWVVQTERQYYSNGGYGSYTWHIHALTSPQSVRLSAGPPRKIGVLLDYEGGHVELFNAASKTSLFTFPKASFSGEVLCPYFSIRETNTLTC